MKRIHKVVFEQSLFAPEIIKQKWPDLQHMITCRDELAAAFDRQARHPKWREDPLLANMTRETGREMLDFYNAVVADGRYIADLATDPKRVARRLKLDVSDLVFETIKSTIRLPGDDKAMTVVGAAIVVSISVVGLAAATAVANSAIDPRKRIVIDESGQVKI